MLAHCPAVRSGEIPDSTCLPESGSEPAYQFVAQGDGRHKLLFRLISAVHPGPGSRGWLPGLRMRIGFVVVIHEIEAVTYMAFAKAYSVLQPFCPSRRRWPPWVTAAVRLSRARSGDSEISSSHHGAEHVQKQRFDVGARGGRCLVAPSRRQVRCSANFFSSFWVPPLSSS